jgi:ATP-dependent helicase HrpA
MTEVPSLDLSLCMHRDAQKIRQQLNTLRARDRPDVAADALQKVLAHYEAAKGALAERLAIPLQIEYPDSLPVSARVDDIAAALARHQVVIVAGETGSGKTTQLPKICLEAGYGRRGLIGHTQPRRLAARSVAQRIADELKVPLGEAVGYQVRFNEQVGERTLVKVMTDGILLTELKHDRLLYRYEVLIIDEAHERSLNIDFILGYLKQLLPKRPDLKVLITSATIDVERFARHFNGAPVIEVSGRSFPVDIVWQPSGLVDDDASDDTLAEQVLRAHEWLLDEERRRGWRMGDVLVFLPGEREIREVSTYLRHLELRDTEVLPLYSRLSNEEQNRIFQPHAGRRIVLATNVAETSLTVPGIRYVIDSGTARISRYSYRSKMQRLPIEAISQASASQRAGRCGRVAEGICVRLYSEQDFANRPAFTEPEILRTNLASVILKMLDANLGDVLAFPFIDPPDRRLWNDGYKILFELGAVDDKRRLTPLGRRIAELPIDPKLARILLEAGPRGCLTEVLVIVCALAIQDPRERPADKQQQSDQAHALDKDPDSDFIACWKLWQRFEQERQALSQNQLKKFCQKQFLSWLRMREWRELHRQLSLLLRSSKVVFNPEPASYEAIHQSLLSGFLGNIARHEEQRDYIGCRNRKLQLAPGSGVLKRKPKWLVSADIIETQKVYARTNARIEPEWVEASAGHLIKKSWSEPHWSKKRGQVCAYEKQSLYGLDIVSRRAVNFSQIDPVQSRTIFIRSALVEGEFDSRNPALKHNRTLIAELEELETKTRRRDIVVDDDTIFMLYEQVIPANVCSAASFDKWFRHATEPERARLCFTRECFVRQSEVAFDTGQFPDYLEQNGIRFPLHYRFDPAAQDDGVTLSVPVRALKQLSADRLEKLVPGLLKEKCLQLVRHLPRSLRKHFVPVPDTVDAILPEVEAAPQPLLEALSAALKRRSGVDVPYQAWNPDLLEPYLKFNIQVLDDRGQVLSEGRHYGQLADSLAGFESTLPVQAEDPQARAVMMREYRDWEFPDLAASILERQAGIEMRMFPALQDRCSHVVLTLSHDELHAGRQTRLAVARLLGFRLSAQTALFPKLLPHYRELALLFATVGLARDFYDDFLIGCVCAHFLPEQLEPVRTRAGFDACFEHGRAEFMRFAQQYSETVFSLLSRFQTLMKQTKGKLALDTALAMSDLQQQLQHLVYPGFLSATPWPNLQDYPRYLEAALIRLEKMPRIMALERQYVAHQREWWQRYRGRRQQFDAQGIHDPELECFRWLLEEVRVSWYAQQLGTRESVSEKRVERQWERVRKT